MAQLLVLAPHPDAEAGIILPTFRFGDTQQKQSEVLTQRTMDGSVRTHVKKQPSAFRQTWVFDLTRLKALEFKAFYDNYAHKKWKVLNTTTNDSWIGYIQINPVALEMISRGVIADSTEKVSITVEFETTE